MNIDEYVPKIIPIIKANEKGLKTSPPYIYNTITTIRVVIDVTKVLFSVWFKDVLNTFFLSRNS